MDTTAPAADPAATLPPTLARRLGAAATGTLLGLTQGFGLYLVSSNLASIQGSLGATAAEASWLISAYFATAVSATLLLTKVRLSMGLRTFTIGSLLIFLAVSVLHLVSDSLASAIAVRAALGLAAAPLTSLCVFYMMQSLPARFAPFGLLLGFAALQVPGPLARVVATELLEVGQWHGLFLFDVTLGLLSLAAIHAVPLAPQPRRNAFCRGDLIAFPLYAIGLGLLCVVISQGRLHWWTDEPWLGVCLAVSIACIGLYAIVDLGRSNPLIDLRWLVSPYMLRFVTAVLLFRIVLSEQQVGVVGLMTALGQSNDQMHTLFALASLGTLVGFPLAGLISLRLGPRMLGVVASALVVIAACMDAGSTSATRPQDLYVSQTLLSVALAAFFSAALQLGFGPVLQDGGKRIVSFLAVFSAAQYLGTLLGTAWINTAVEERRQLHYQALVRHIEFGDPDVALRLAQLGGSVARWVNDPIARGKQGVSLLAQQVNRESVVLAYLDVFQMIAALSLLMFVWLSILAWRNRRRAQPQVADSAATDGPSSGPALTSPPSPTTT